MNALQIDDSIGLLADDGLDGRFGLWMSGLAGVATTVAVAILLSLYFQSGRHRARDVVRHGLAVVAALGLLVFVASDLRHAAMTYLGINPSKTMIEFEIRLPKTALTGATDTQVELLTNKNQTLAEVQNTLAPDGTDRSILKGSVALDFRTTDRMMVLNLPGQVQRQFKLRLAATPSHSAQFGPWHLADRALARGQPAHNEPTDAFAIRYRVL
jgi:hypothetical protein